MKSFLTKIRKDLSVLKLKTIDYWNDPNSIGLACKENLRKLVYVCIGDTKKKTFYYDCEKPTGKRLTSFKTVESKENVSYERVLSGTTRHLIEDWKKNWGRRKGLKILQALLMNKDPRVGNAAAYHIGVIGDSSSVPLLVKAAKNPKNKNYTGSFIYALEKHNCSELLVFLVTAALNYSYESQCHALRILKNQKFSASPREMQMVERMITMYPKRENKCERYSILLRELKKSLKKVKPV